MSRCWVKPRGEGIPKTRGLGGGNSQVPTLHFGNIPHPWPFTLHEAQGEKLSCI